MATNDSLPIVCTLPEGDRELRRAELMRSFAELVTEVAELSDGYRLRFARRDGLIETLGRYVELESGCCSFLTFALEVPAGADFVALRLTGPEGTKDFLRSAVGDLGTVANRPPADATAIESAAAPRTGTSPPRCCG